MNIRKPIDYSAMFMALDTLMMANLSQMKLYCEIGRLVCSRPEKGAAVAVAEYLQCRYPEDAGFSPRNLRRMRDFYRMYENTPQLMEQALCLNWTQNVVVMEADLSMEQCMWYLRACAEHGWSKSELQNQIDIGAHMEVSLDGSSKTCYNDFDGEQETRASENDESAFYLPRQYMQEPDGRVCDEGHGKESGVGEEFQNCFCSNQYRGNWTPSLSSGTPQADRTWNTVRWPQRPPANQSGLRRIRLPDWHGSNEPPQYVPHLWRGLCQQNAPFDGLYKPPRRCGRSVVHRRFRDGMARCMGRLPRPV